MLEYMNEQKKPNRNITIQNTSKVNDVSVQQRNYIVKARGATKHRRNDVCNVGTKESPSENFPRPEKCLMLF